MSQRYNNNYFLIVITAVAALAGILFGFDTGVVSGAILFINDEYSLNNQTNGLVVSAVLLGALMGAICSGRLADYLGRRKLLLIDALIFVVGTLATAIAPSIEMIIIGRIIVGVAIGIASYVAPLYISEISPAKYRGALVSLNQLAITVGIFLSYVVDYYYAPNGQWRWMFAVGVIPAIILLFGLLFMPDSPRWLVSKGHVKNALDVLQQIYGNKESAEKEVMLIQGSISKEHNINWRMLFSPSIRGTLTIGIGLAVLQQITGINTIVYYSPTIFEMAGFTSATTAIFATMGVGIVFVVFTIISLPLIDTVGRRPLLLFGLAGMAVSLFILAIAFHSPNHSSLKWISLGSMFLYIACFAISLGPIMWLMITEIYPLKVRGVGCSLATAANWGSNMFVALTFLTLVDALGASGAFMSYGVISILGIFFIYYLVPETKHVTLEQIEESLKAGLSYRNLGRIDLIPSPMSMQNVSSKQS